MKVLFFTNIPSPYRVDFFNEMGRYCNLTVCFERKLASDRHEKWEGESAKNYKEEYLDLKPYGPSGSRGDGIKQYIKSHEFDVLIFSGYSSPSVVSAILYCRIHKIRYFIEYDGGFNKKDPFHKRILKKVLIIGAEGHFITCNELKQYLMSFGVPKEKLFFYPFSSVKQQDIIAAPPTNEDKTKIKQEIGIVENVAVISVGQFIYRKGFDILLKAADKVDRKIGIYIIGGVPTGEYKELKERLCLNNVHFVDFMPKEELRKFYLAADLFVFPTREDIWGLVVNEAMACGLPVISTDHCISALELVKNGQNGYIVYAEDADALADRITCLMYDDETRKRMSEYSIQTIGEYTIENMVKTHVGYLTAYQQN